MGSLDVASIETSALFLNWTAPFTLDITATVPDITYCVDVVSSTSSATLHSQCGITEMEFTYPLLSRISCDGYNFTVTPVNVVGNGPGKSTHFSQVLSGVLDSGERGQTGSVQVFFIAGPELVVVTTGYSSVSLLMVGLW